MPQTENPAPEWRGGARDRPSSPFSNDPSRSRRTWGRETFLFVTLLPSDPSVAGTRPPGLPDALRGPRWRTHPTDPPAARRPGPRALTCSGARILGGRAPGSAARLPGPRRAAAAAAPAPRRAHGAREPHFLSPQSRPADHPRGPVPRRPRPGAPPGAGDPPARSGAQRERGAREAGRRTDGLGTRGRSGRQRSGGGRRPSPRAGRIRGGGGGRDLRELECARRGAGEARTAAPGRRGGGAPLLFLII